MQNDSEAKKFLNTSRGRGTGVNMAGRFEKYTGEADGNYLDELYSENGDGLQARTQTFPDTSRTIISTNDSPDVGMEATVNPYRGCEHGCIYCYARPTHEYLGLSPGLDFETKIFVKHDAAQLLAAKLSSKAWQPRIVSFSGITDCYQPLERIHEIT
ncbi:MAG: radical SAM protein, partial [Micavibrio aeruginosavorus]